MKKVITHSICMLVMITSIATSFAGNFSEVKLEGKDKEITLTLDNVKAGQQLSIKDENGIILYKSIIEQEGLFSNKFDLSALPDGSYYFEHEKDFQISIIPFKVSYSKVTFDKDNEKTIFKPVVRVKDNNLYFSKLDLEKEDVQIKIYFNDSKASSEYKLLHTENFEDSTKIERIYDLSNPNRGDYKVVVNANKRSYIEHFSI